MNVAVEFEPHFRQLMLDRCLVHKTILTLTRLRDELVEDAERHVSNYETTCIGFNGLRLSWTISRATLHRFASSKHFSHPENQRERGEIVKMRFNYRDWVSDYKAQGNFVFQQDKT